MRKVVCVFVDVARMYHSTSIMSKGIRLNYERYLQKAIGNNELHRAYAYGVQLDNEAEYFISALKTIGYETKYKKAKIIKDYSVDPPTLRPSIRDTSWSLGIAMDVVRNINHIDCVVLGSNDPELVPLIEWIKEQGAKVIIYGLTIHRDLRQIADMCLEITDDVFDTKVES